MADLILTDGSDTVTVRLEYDYKDHSYLNYIRNASNNNGDVYLLKYSDYRQFKIPIDYVTIGDKLIIDWWAVNKSNITMSIEGEDVNVKILNKSTPLPKLRKPYSNVYYGTLELELQ